jgi:hypothetical protein
MRSGRGIHSLGSDRTATALLALAVAASVGFLLSLASRLSFIADDWELLVKRPGFSSSSLLDPFHQHLVLAPALIYKALLATFGMGSALPYFVVSIAFFALTAVLLYVYLRRRVGAWLALLAVLPLLFLGAAYEDLLWAFQVGFFGATAAGMGMLVALDREDRLGDRIACLLLLVSLTFASVGIPFAVAAVVDVAMGRRPRRRRAYVVVVPLVAYAAWWIGWGHTAEDSTSLENLYHLPQYVFDAAASGIGSLLGRNPVDVHNPGHPSLIFRLLLVAGLLAATARVVRLRRIPRGLAVALALGLAFWGLAALNANFTRVPIVSRYQYPSALFLLLIAAEAVRGVRITRLVMATLALVGAVAVMGGFALLRGESKNWEAMGDGARATLAAIEIAGERVRPDFPILVEGSTFSDREYTDAVRKYGTPAYDEADLLAHPDPYGEIADRFLLSAQRISLRPPVAAPARRCQEVRIPKNQAAAALALEPSRLQLGNPGSRPVEVLIGRFSEEPTTDLGKLAAGARRSLSIPADSSPRPWRLSFTGTGRVRLCSAQPARPAAG